jgi:hypothetical protein
VSEPRSSPGVVGAVSTLGQTLITTLPPAFVMLCVVNVAFLAAVLWFLNSETEQKLVIVSHVVDACMADGLAKSKHQ